MGIKNYLKRKKQNNQEITSEEKKDIIPTIESAITDLTAYYHELERDNIHKVNSFSEGSNQRKLAEQMQEEEKEILHNALFALEKARNVIGRNAVFDNVFHYDAEHYDEC